MQILQDDLCYEINPTSLLLSYIQNEKSPWANQQRKKVVIFKSHCCHFMFKDIFKGNAKSCSLNSNNCCPFEKQGRKFKICIG